MLENIQILTNILNEVEFEVGVDSAELGQLQSIKEFLKLPIYQLLFVTGEPHSLEEKKKIGEYLYNKAVKLYNLKEFQQSYKSIIDSINKAQPISLLTLKLLIANLHSLGRFETAGLMYVKYYEITGEIDCLFYAGMCDCMMHSNEVATEHFKMFVERASKSVKDKVIYANLIKSANNFIKFCHNHK